LLARAKYQSEAGDDGAWTATMNEVFRLDQVITTTPALTVAGAAVKLRRLLDPEPGLANGHKDTDAPCLRQILAAIEQEAGQAQPAPVSVTGGTDPLIALADEKAAVEAKLKAIDDALSGAEREAIENPLLDQLVAIEDRLASAVPISLSGAIVQITRLREYARDFEWSDYAEGIVDNLIGGIERLGETAASELPGAPAAMAESGGLYALLLSWLALRESCQGRSSDEEGDKEVARITGEMRAVERAILGASPVTESDWRAMVAMVVIRAREGHCYANVGVIENLYRRLVIDRMTDPVGRSRERGYSRRRVADARAHLAEHHGEEPQ